ncbi:MAG: T9SS type A sorting domain-containing protein [Bacteroidetes bacterium]|nr:T9SS type A sorting domain-containing protein [Bacteroidota bacterium]
MSANEGLGKSLYDKMYFVQLMPDSGSYVYVYEYTGHLGADLGFTVKQYPVPHYEVCANAFEKNPSTGGFDSLSSSIAWAQNAFYLNGVIHYTHSSDIGTGWCGISYGRIDINTGKAEVAIHGEQGTDLCYPAVAAFGDDSNSHEAMIAYLQSDISMTPQCGVVGVDKDMKWSARRVVKTGDTMVNILYPPDYAVQPERWGDYTGICRRYNTTFPEVWLGAAYGANTPPRMASYGTWITEVIKYPSDNRKADVQIYPNPATEMFTLEFDNEMVGRITVQMFDMTGKLVYKLFDDQLKVSRNRLSFNSLALPKGMYFIRVSRNGKPLFSKKLTVRN